jgi:hypothetical protein
MKHFAARKRTGALTSGGAEDKLGDDGAGDPADDQGDVAGSEERYEQSGQGADARADDAQHDSFGHFPSG